MGVIFLRFLGVTLTVFSNTAEYRGSKCNPLFLTTEYTNNKDARKRKLTFKQEQRDLIGASIYKGKMPELANEAASAPTEEEGA